MKLNESNYVHGAYAVLMQGLLGAPLFVVQMPVPFVVSGAFAIGWFISREHAQREEQLARERGVEVEKLLPWEGLQNWSLDSKLDAAVPAVLVLILDVLSLVVL